MSKNLIILTCFSDVVRRGKRTRTEEVFGKGSMLSLRITRTLWVIAIFYIQFSSIIFSFLINSDYFFLVTIVTNFTESRLDLKKLENTRDHTKMMTNATSVALKDIMATIVQKESCEFAKENLKR